MPELGKQFHGSRFAFLEPGDFIEPGSETGIQQFNYDSMKFPTVETEGGNVHRRAERVYSTSDEASAWDFAEKTLLKAGPYGRVADSRDTGGRPYVYEVEPIEGERVTETHAPGEMASARARVVQRIDIPPPDVYTDTYDEYEMSEKNPTGTPGTTNEERTARQGQLAGHGINWPNYETNHWEGYGDPEGDDPDLTEITRDFTGMTPTELDVRAEEQWTQRLVTGMKDREAKLPSNLNRNQFDHPRLF